MIGLSAAGIELSLRDRNNNAVHTSAVSSGNRSWINRLAFELGGFAAIACGATSTATAWIPWSSTCRPRETEMPS